MAERRARRRGRTLTPLDKGIVRFTELSLTLVYPKVFRGADLQRASQTLLAQWPVLGSRLNTLRTALIQPQEGQLPTVWSGRAVDNVLTDLVNVTDPNQAGDNARALDAIFHIGKVLKKEFHRQVFYIQVLLLHDATILRFVLQRPLCDAFGAFTIARAYCSLLDGKQPLPTSFDRFSLQLRPETITPATESNGAQTAPRRDAIDEAHKSLTVIAQKKVLDAARDDAKTVAQPDTRSAGEGRSSTAAKDEGTTTVSRNDTLSSAYSSSPPVGTPAQDDGSTTGLLPDLNFLREAILTAEEENVKIPAVRNELLPSRKSSLPHAGTPKRVDDSKTALPPDLAFPAEPSSTAAEKDATVTTVPDDATATGEDNGPTQLTQTDQCRQLFDWSWRTLAKKRGKFTRRNKLHPERTRRDDILHIPACQIQRWAAHVQGTGLRLTEHDLLAAFIYQCVYDQHSSQDFTIAVSIRRQLENQTPIRNSMFLVPVNVGGCYDRHRPEYTQLIVIAAEVRRTIVEARQRPSVADLLQFYSCDSTRPLVPRWLGRKAPQIIVASWADMPLFDVDAQGTNPSFVFGEVDVCDGPMNGILMEDLVIIWKAVVNGQEDGFWIRGRLSNEAWGSIISKVNK
ncbi:uncharacterized protein BDV17DRAFT_288077 [Aspergillus undulatus]|uniref:uncharacterized protein n=1 Tax=Aspergillus undulatus TaxID=1810928 RepID=UPI003CCE51A1